jgi:alpha-tubulin suppressor-like RCC1 family protein
MESVDVGTSHVCAVAGNGSAWCWGSAANGRLGSSSPTDASTPRGTATLPAAAVQIAAGSSHSCTVLEDGTVACFGRNNKGQLGRNPSDVASSDAPTTVAVLSNVSRVTAGDEFTCAVASGQVQCFGANTAGGLGDGTLTGRHTPAPVSNIVGTVIDVVAGEFHACAVTEAEDVWCWGTNIFGQLGMGDRGFFSSPRKISGLAIGTTTTTTSTTTTTTSTTTTTTTIVSAVPPTGSTGASPNVAPTQSPAHTPTQTTATSAELAAVTTTTTTSKKSVAASSPSRRLSVRRTRSLSASRIAAAAGLAIPRRSKGSMRITLVKGRDRCRFVGSSVRGVKRGTCSLRVVLIPKKGRTISRTVTVRVT